MTMCLGKFNFDVYANITDEALRKKSIFISERASEHIPFV